MAHKQETIIHLQLAATDGFEEDDRCFIRRVVRPALHRPIGIERHKSAMPRCADDQSPCWDLLASSEINNRVIGWGWALASNVEIIPEKLQRAVVIIGGHGP